MIWRERERVREHPERRLSMFKTLCSLLIAAALVLGGCLEIKTVLVVQKDGSGTIEQTMYMPAEKSADAKPKFDRDKAQAAAAGMGAGVVLKSFESLPDKDGRVGFKMVYAVPDVSALTFTLMPSMGKQDEKDQVKIAFSKSPKPRLMITMPPLGKDEDKPAKVRTPEQKEQSLKMLQAIGKNMHLQFIVKPAGTIAKTDATYVSQAKDAVTLLNYNLNAVVQDAAMLKKFADMEDKFANDADRIKAAREDAELGKYVQVEPKKTVEIVFE